MTRRALIPLLVVLGVMVPVATGATPKPPDTKITAGPPDPLASNSASFTFTFTSSDGNGADEVRYGCAIDSQSFRSCTSPAVYHNIPDGLHTFFVFSIKDHVPDPTPASWTWTVDTTPPPEVAAQRNVRYRQLVLSWAPPASTGADHVVVFRSTKPKQQPSVQVYAGAATSYTEARFDNSGYHAYRIVAVDRAGNASRGTDVVVTASALLLAPANGARVARAPTLAWRSVPHAKYYNVQLWRGGEKILSAWPRSTQLKLKKTWTYAGRKYRLKGGSYTWFVWPSFGTAAKGSYGQLAGRSAFQVTGR